MNNLETRCLCVQLSRDTGANCNLAMSSYETYSEVKVLLVANASADDFVAQFHHTERLHQPQMLRTPCRSAAEVRDAHIAIASHSKLHALHAQNQSQQDS